SLGDLGQATLHYLVGRDALEILVLEDYAAALGMEQAGHGVQNRGLPRAVGADEGDDLPFLNSKGNPLYSVDAAVVHMDIINFQHCHRLTPPSSCPDRPR